MKKFLFIIALAFIVNSIKAQTCYFYITCDLDEEFEIYEGEILKEMFTNVFKANCETNKISIQIDFREALKSKYPKSYIYAGNTVHVWKFESENEALKAKRKKIGDLKSEDWKIVEFNFKYYGD